MESVLETLLFPPQSAVGQGETALLVAASVLGGVLLMDHCGVISIDGDEFESTKSATQFSSPSSVVVELPPMTSARKRLLSEIASRKPRQRKVRFAAYDQVRVVRYSRREFLQKKHSYRAMAMKKRENKAGRMIERIAAGGCRDRAYRLSAVDMAFAREDVAELMAPYLEQQAKLEQKKKTSRRIFGWWGLRGAVIEEC